MRDHADGACASQAISAFFAEVFKTSPLANFVRIVGALFVAAVVALNASHSLSTFAPLGPVSAGSVALLFGLAGIVGPLALHATLNAGSILRGLVCALTGLACVVLCVSTNLGATSAGRGDSAAKRTAEIAAHNELQAQRIAIGNEIVRLTAPRDAAIVQADIDGGGSVSADVLARTKRCSDVTLPASQRACAPLVALRSELERARRKDELEKTLAHVLRKLEADPPPASADAQTEQLVWIAGVIGISVDATNVSRGTNALNAVLLELIAALTLTVATIIDDADRRRRAEEERAAALPKIMVAAEPTVAAAAPAPPAATAVSLQPTVRPAPLVPSEQRVLAALRSSDGRLVGTHRTIARIVGMPASTLSAAVRHLAERGAVRQGDCCVELIGLRAVA